MEELPIVLLILGLIMIVVCLIMTAEMSDEDFIIGSLFGMGVALIILSVVTHQSYKQGQIDALSGNKKYELVTHSDSTKTWERIKEQSK